MPYSYSKSIMRLCRTAPWCQSQNNATFTAHIKSFEQKIYSCLVLKYLGLPVLTKYFIQICLFVSWARPQFFCPYFKTSLTSEVHEKLHWSQPSHPCNCLGAIQFVLLCKVFFDKLQLNRFKAWAEIKTCIFWGRITAKVQDKFQMCLDL